MRARARSTARALRDAVAHARAPQLPVNAAHAARACVPTVTATASPYARTRVLIAKPSRRSRRAGWPRACQRPASPSSRSTKMMTPLTFRGAVPLLVALLVAPLAACTDRATKGDCWVRRGRPDRAPERPGDDWQWPATHAAQRRRHRRGGQRSGGARAMAARDTSVHRERPDPPPAVTTPARARATAGPAPSGAGTSGNGGSERRQRGRRRAA